MFVITYLLEEDMWGCSWCYFRLLFWLNLDIRMPSKCEPRHASLTLHLELSNCKLFIMDKTRLVQQKAKRLIGDLWTC